MRGSIEMIGGIAWKYICCDKQSHAHTDETLTLTLRYTAVMFESKGRDT